MEIPRGLQFSTRFLSHTTVSKTWFSQILIKSWFLIIYNLYYFVFRTHTNIAVDSEDVREDDPVDAEVSCDVDEQCSVASGMRHS